MGPKPIYIDSDGVCWGHFLYEYEWEGSTFGFSIAARSREEADARLKRLPLARYIGQQDGEPIPAGPGVGLLRQSQDVPPQSHSEGGGMKAREIVVKVLDGWHDGNRERKTDEILAALKNAGFVFVDCSNCFGKGAAEIRPKSGAVFDPYSERCEDTDEVVGAGFLHVEQMDKNLYWARLNTGIPGKDVVMWFRSRGRITLVAELD